MSCILRISGENFKVDEFLSIAKEQPYEKFKKGEEHKIRKAKHEKSGCNFDLSLADFDEFEKQKNDAINFLEQNFSWLKRLDEFGLSKYEIPEIDFGINLNQEYAIEGLMIEPKISKLVTDLNFSILISIYKM